MMDDYGNDISTHDRSYWFGYIWWLCGLTWWTEFAMDNDDNDTP